MSEDVFKALEEKFRLIKALNDRGLRYESSPQPLPDPWKPATKWVPWSPWAKAPCRFCGSHPLVRPQVARRPAALHRAWRDVYLESLVLRSGETHTFFGGVHHELAVTRRLERWADRIANKRDEPHWKAEGRNLAFWMWVFKRPAYKDHEAAWFSAQRAKRDSLFQDDHSA